MSRTREWLEAHREYPHDWCLIWPFARESRVGRGHVSVGEGETDWAHRVMCEMVKGPAPADKPQAAHSCGNGHLGCVNPRHLSWANNSENQLQRYVDGRGNPNAHGPRSMFTDEQIAEIRAKWGEFTQTKLAEMYNCSLGTIQYYLKYRVQRGHSGDSIKTFRPEEDALLRDGISRRLNFTQIAELLPGRSKAAVSARAYRLGLKSGQPPHPNQRYASQLPTGEL